MSLTHQLLHAHTVASKTLVKSAGIALEMLDLPDSVGGREARILAPDTII